MVNSISNTLLVDIGQVQFGLLRIATRLWPHGFNAFFDLTIHPLRASILAGTPLGVWL